MEKYGKATIALSQHILNNHFTFIGDELANFLPELIQDACIILKDSDRKKNNKHFFGARDSSENVINKGTVKKKTNLG